MSARAVALLRRLLALTARAESAPNCIAFDDALEGEPLAEWLRIRREAKKIVDEADRVAKGRPN
jgi:hypothetical protein